jgi:hypothetical protein
MAHDLLGSSAPRPPWLSAGDVQAKGVFVSRGQLFDVGGRPPFRKVQTERRWSGGALPVGPEELDVGGAETKHAGVCLPRRVAFGAVAPGPAASLLPSWPIPPARPGPPVGSHGRSPGPG